MPKGLAKQILSYGLIILADKIATDHVFCDGNYIDEDEFINSIKTEEEVDEAGRAYETLCAHFFKNIKKFSDDEKECWGKHDVDVVTKAYSVYMISSVFTDVCNQICKIHPTVMLEYLRANKLLIENGKKDKKGWCVKRFGQTTIRTRAFIINPENIDIDGIIEDDISDLPF